ncbi:dihydropteroate synthase [Candidatus Desantisbacteria bacterium]|nr:dihydropteroate synthase [Candidatus Desantisbacteria bacterium]
MAIVIAENIHVISPRIKEAIKSRDAKTIQEVAVKSQEMGADFVDLNIGPASKEGVAIMEWMVNTVQEVVTLPLFLDTLNVAAIEAGLKLCKQKAVINSISCIPERMAALFPLVQKYNAGCVCLLISEQGLPRDNDERGMLAADLIGNAMEYNVPNEDLWFDPFTPPIAFQQDAVKATLESVMMFEEMAPGCKVTCGLSNVSNGLSRELRDILNQTFLIMLERNGMTSAIADAFDERLIEIAKGKRGDLQKIVWQVMDGEEPAIGSLTQEQIEFVKTARVLLGHKLFSPSWLSE